MGRKILVALYGSGSFAGADRLSPGHNEKDTQKNTGHTQQHAAHPGQSGGPYISLDDISSAPGSRSPYFWSAWRRGLSDGLARSLLFQLRHACRSGTAVMVGLFSVAGDRKSTRLNSSHVRISYAVFC